MASIQQLLTQHFAFIFENALAILIFSISIVVAYRHRSYFNLSEKRMMKTLKEFNSAKSHIQNKEQLKYFKSQIKTYFDVMRYGHFTRLDIYHRKAFKEFFIKNKIDFNDIKRVRHSVTVNKNGQYYLKYLLLSNIILIFGIIFFTVMILMFLYLFFFGGWQIQMEPKKTIAAIVIMFSTLIMYYGLIFSYSTLKSMLKVRKQFKRIYAYNLSIGTEQGNDALDAIKQSTRCGSRED